jgi:hypothetical protein
MGILQARNGLLSWFSSGRLFRAGYHVRKVIQIAAAVLLTIGAALVIAAWRSGDRCEVYLRQRAHVFEDGQEIAGARVFKAASGKVLLTFPDYPSVPFIFFPEDLEVGECNSQTFLNLGIIGLQEYDRGGFYPCAGSGKQEIKQDIVSSATSLGFNYWKNTLSPTVGRVEIRW